MCTNRYKFCTNSASQGPGSLVIDFMIIGIMMFNVGKFERS